jgi:hypothetical protein
MWQFWKKKTTGKIEEPEEKKEANLLQELCGDDAELHGFVSNYLCVNPLTAISNNTLDSLIAAGDKDGDYRPALDKAIFEASQNPGETEKYLAVIQDITAKAIPAIEKEKAAAEKAGLADRAAFLGNRIEAQRLLQKRVGDILDISSKYYHERLLELGEDARRAERTEQRREAESKEWRTGLAERAAHEARKQAIKRMGRAERKEAEKQEQRDEAAEQERRNAREEQRRETDLEDREEEDLEKAEREARQKELRED